MSISSNIFSYCLKHQLYFSIQISENATFDYHVCVACLDASLKVLSHALMNVFVLSDIKKLVLNFGNFF